MGSSLSVGHSQHMSEVIRRMGISLEWPIHFKYKINEPMGKTQSSRLCFPGKAHVSSSSWTVHHVLNLCGWTVGISGWPMLVLCSSPHVHSFWKCTKRLPEHRWHLFARNHSGAFPPSLPLTAEMLRVTWRYPSGAVCGEATVSGVVECLMPGLHSYALWNLC